VEDCRFRRATHTRSDSSVHPPSSFFPSSPPPPPPFSPFLPAFPPASKFPSRSLVEELVAIDAPFQPNCVQPHLFHVPQVRVQLLWHRPQHHILVPVLSPSSPLPFLFPPSFSLSPSVASQLANSKFDRSRVRCFSIGGTRPFPAFSLFGVPHRVLPHSFGAAIFRFVSFSSSPPSLPGLSRCQFNWLLQLLAIHFRRNVPFASRPNRCAPPPSSSVSRLFSFLLLSFHSLPDFLLRHRSASRPRTLLSRYPIFVGRIRIPVPPPVLPISSFPGAKFLTPTRVSRGFISLRPPQLQNPVRPHDILRFCNLFPFTPTVRALINPGNAPMSRCLAPSFFPFPPTILFATTTSICTTSFRHILHAKKSRSNSSSPAHFFSGLFPPSGLGSFFSSPLFPTTCSAPSSYATPPPQSCLLLLSSSSSFPSMTTESASHC